MALNYVETEYPGVMAQSLIAWDGVGPKAKEMNYYKFSCDTKQGRLKAIGTVVFEKATGKVDSVFVRYYV